MSVKIDPKKQYEVKLAKRVALGAIRLSPIQSHTMSGETLNSILDNDKEAVASYDHTGK